MVSDLHVVGAGVGMVLVTGDGVGGVWKFRKVITSLSKVSVSADICELQKQFQLPRPSTIVDYMVYRISKTQNESGCKIMHVKL